MDNNSVSKAVDGHLLPR